MSEDGQAAARMGLCQAGSTITRDDENTDWATRCTQTATDLLAVEPDDEEEGPLLVPLCSHHMEALNAAGALHPEGGGE